MPGSSSSKPTSQAAPQASPQTIEEEEVDAPGLTPLVSAHPFDYWRHCLACHITRYSGTHRWQNCPNPTTHAPVPGTDLGWLKDVSRTTRRGPLIDLIRVIGCQASDDGVFLLHVNRRDALYLRMLQAMEASGRPIDHETWFRAMGAYCMLTDIFQQRRLHKPKVIAEEAFGRLMNDDENVFAFLRRVTSSEDNLQALERSFRSSTSALREPLERTETALRKLKQDFDLIWNKWDAIIQHYLDTSDNIKNLNPADALLMRKAYAVMIKAQPRFDFHDLYATTWSFPDLGNVVRDVGFQFPEPQAG